MHRGRKGQPEQAPAASGKQQQQQPARNKLLDAVTLCFAQKNNYYTQENDARTEIVNLCTAEADVIEDYLERCQREAAIRKQKFYADQKKLHESALLGLAAMPDIERHRRSRLKVLEQRVAVTLNRLKELEWLGLHLHEMLNATVKQEEIQRYLMEKTEARQRRHVDDVYGAKLFRAPLLSIGPCPFAHANDCPFLGNCYGSPIQGHLKPVAAAVSPRSAKASSTAVVVVRAAAVPNAANNGPYDDDEDFYAAVDAIGQIPTRLLK